MTTMFLIKQIKGYKYSVSEDGKGKHHFKTEKEAMDFIVSRTKISTLIIIKNGKKKTTNIDLKRKNIEEANKVKYKKAKEKKNKVIKSNKEKIAKAKKLKKEAATIKKAAKENLKSKKAVKTIAKKQTKKAIKKSAVKAKVVKSKAKIDKMEAKREEQQKIDKHKKNIENIKISNDKDRASACKKKYNTIKYRTDNSYYVVSDPDILIVKNPPVKSGQYISTRINKKHMIKMRTLTPAAAIMFSIMIVTIGLFI